HHLWTFASRPVHQFSDMNGYGPFKSAIAAYNLYWISLAIVLVVITLLLYPRGLDTGLKQRLKAMRSRFSRPCRIMTATGIAGCLFMGGFIVYNTVFLNEFETSEFTEKRAVRYEKTYNSWENKSQAHVIGIAAKVDLFPAERRVESRGEIRLQNETNSPIDTLFVQVPRAAMVRDLHLGPEAVRVHSDQELGVYLFALKEAMRPGDTTEIHFDFELDERGFKDTDVNTRLVANGTFLTVAHLFPASGYNPYDLYELTDNDKRDHYGLTPKPRLAPADDPTERMRTLIGAHADWIDFDVVLSTSSDQIALAPGDLLKEWSQEGRRFFHYRTPGKILCYAAVMSGKYEVKRDVWGDVGIEVYYHPDHASNIDLIVESVQRSLEYFTREFSPYQFSTVRVIEFPRYEIFAEAFPGFIPLSEGYGFIAKYDEKKVKEVFRVMAHEMGHQWWAHQVIGGNVEGTYVLSEVMAQYSAVVISRGEYEPSRMDQYVCKEIDRYLRGRSRETEEEVPLVRTNQETWYEHYAKGFVVMNSLVEYIGEDRINEAIRKFIAETAFQEPPFTVASDLVDHFKAVTPDSMLYLVEDCFDRIVLFENQAIGAECEPIAEGRYQVTLSYKARKWVADGKGAEIAVPMHDLIEFAVFDDQGRELGRMREWLDEGVEGETDSGTNEITIIVDHLPATAGIDPHYLLIDKKADNNVVEVVMR
ncbi:MAG: hypothetical protein KOO60_04985, partial [Gemmatimonadales bacterium]|nr:hypothetical protein [Gemmatimonadales bacterium]